MKLNWAIGEIYSFICFEFLILMGGQSSLLSWTVGKF
jgi:hypothetical protein